MSYWWQALQDNRGAAIVREGCRYTLRAATGYLSQIYTVQRAKRFELGSHSIA
jgi:hypothetical protein